MKFALIGCYYNMESYKGMTDGLISSGHTVDFFPMLYYFHSNKSNLEKHFELFLDNKSSDDKMIVSPGKIDVIIWRCYLSTAGTFEMTKSRGIINILYNCTDPYETFNNNLQTNGLDRILKYFDMVFTTSKISIPLYQKYGVKYVYHTTMGIDSNIHKPQSNNKNIQYVCDVSFVINTLYINNAHGLDRKKLLERITKIPNIRVHIYGPRFISEHFPSNYIEEIPYDQTHKIFSSSRININTHHVIDNGDSINERTYQIIGSGGLMLSDIESDLDGNLVNGQSFIKLDEANLEEQIMKILKTYEQDPSIDQIKTSAIKTSKKFTFKRITDDIVSKIQKDILKIEPNTTVSRCFAYDISTDINNVRKIEDVYSYIEELHTLLKLIKLTGPIPELIEQLEIFSQIPELDINKEMSKILHI